MSCCDVNGLDRMFRGRYVARERGRFLKRGPDARQRAFYDGGALEGASVLDVGCGVGAIGLSALRHGAAEAHLVDVSRDYVRAAEELAAHLGVERQVTAQLGDAAELDLPHADLVVLDRVVCCYPEAESLLTRLAGLSRERLVYSYPSPTPWMRLGRRLLNGAMWLSRNRYRFYLHDPDRLLAAACRRGHRPVDERSFGVWRLVRLERTTRPLPGAS